MEISRRLISQQQEPASKATMAAHLDADLQEVELLAPVPLKVSAIVKIWLYHCVHDRHATAVKHLCSCDPCRTCDTRRSRESCAKSPLVRQMSRFSVEARLGLCQVGLVADCAHCLDAKRCSGLHARSETNHCYVLHARRTPTIFGQASPCGPGRCPTAGCPPAPARAGSPSCSARSAARSAAPLPSPPVLGTLRKCPSICPCPAAPR